MSHERIQEAIDGGITHDMYRRALEIYLKHAYPLNEDTRRAKMSQITNPNYFLEGIPRESRFGSYVNPHMKLRCGYLDGSYHAEVGFWVAVNDVDESMTTQIQCKAIAMSVESDWEQSDIPVKPSQRRESCHG